MNDLAKILVISGIAILSAGLILLALNKIPGFGRLPGDIIIKRENFTFYFPLMTSIIISIMLSLFFIFFNRK